MRYGYRYECDFAEVDVDEAIQWYKKANKLYEKNKLNRYS
jgi:TPR repeat protein